MRETITAGLGIGMIVSAISLAFWLLVLDGWDRDTSLSYPEQVREQKIKAQIILTWPLWGWFGVPIMVLVSVASVGLSLWLAGTALIRAAWPGELPSDHDTPQGGGYR